MSLNEQVIYASEPISLSNYSSSVGRNNIATMIDMFGNSTVILSNESSITSNLSSDNGTLKRDFVFDRTDVRVLFITLYSLVFCCCFFGNLLVILVVTLSRRLRSITNFFLANLAVSDLCVGVFCVMQNLSIYLIDSWVFGEFLCKMYQFVHSLSYTPSIFILVVICMERYFAIIHPITCKQILTPRRLRVKKYKPEVIWSDGDWEASDDYWGSKDVLTWLYNSSPVKDNVVVNDRWGNGTTCTHGGVWNCADRYNPGHLVPHKWENAFTIDKHSWSYRRNSQLKDYLTPQEIINQLVITVSCGGNFLVNVGPTKEGTIAPILAERLSQLGQWLQINGQAIYGSSIWQPAQNDSSTEGVWYTYKAHERKIFAIILEKAITKTENQEIILGSVDSQTVRIANIELLDHKSFPIIWEPLKTGISVILPNNWKGQWELTLVLNIELRY